MVRDLIAIPFFFLVLYRLGRCFYEQKKDALIFVGFTTLLYVLCALRGGREAITGIFTNGSEGLTILSCILMPLTFCMILEWMKRGKTKITDIVIAILLVIAGQYCDAKGGFYIALMLLLAVAVKLVRKGYAYVTSSGRFKKRI